MSQLLILPIDSAGDTGKGSWRGNGKVLIKPNSVGFPRPLIVPDNLTYSTNVLSSYNILESACKLGIKKIILASSITVCTSSSTPPPSPISLPNTSFPGLVLTNVQIYGITYADGNVDYAYFPVDEDHPTTPMDVYATSKLVMETTAASFARRFPDVDIYCLRIGAVITPEMFEEKFKAYVSPTRRQMI